ncbi:hypothetical protein M2138_000004 [Dysgonomonadaceae bacterium PH5-43]|nr:hypothetical protein [Dysgonomonadaceae bacterium PH5-43]
MKKVNTKSIGELLKSFIEEDPQMANKLAEARLIDYWNSMNSAITKYTSSLYVNNRVLYVRLSSSVLKRELYLSKSSLIQKLNAECGRGIIDDIVFLS